MSLTWFKKNGNSGYKKGHLDITEKMYDAPFFDIIASMNPDYLEDAVASNFDNILPHRKIDEYKYFRLFPSWINLVGEKLDDILYYYLQTMDDFKKMIELFPEYTTEIFEYLIDSFINKDETCYDDGIGYRLDFIDDIMIPMSDLERYQNYHFNVIRKRSLEILDSSITYDELWDMLWAYETYFDIPREYFSEYIAHIFNEFVEDFDERELARLRIPIIFEETDYDCLAGFFRDAEGYWFFMDKLPWLITQSGLDLYTMMIKTLGPVKEVIDLHERCAEYIIDE